MKEELCETLITGDIHMSNVIPLHPLGTKSNTNRNPKPKGITKLKELQKRVMEVHPSFLQDVRLRDDYDGWDAPDRNKPLPVYYLNTSKKNPHPHLCFRKIYDSSYGFGGGQHGRQSWKRHNNFSYTRARVDKEGVIVSVHYKPDNDLLNEFLRDVLDPSIPNNFEDAYAEKEYDLVVTTHHFTQKTLKVCGRTFDEARQKLVDAETDLDAIKKYYPERGLHIPTKYNGMRTTEDQGVSYYPSSYEEWRTLIS